MGPEYNRFRCLRLPQFSAHDISLPAAHCDGLARLLCAAEID